MKGESTSASFPRGNTGLGLFGDNKILRSIGLGLDLTDVGVLFKKALFSIGLGFELTDDGGLFCN
jgi:hypothetical protein